QATIMYYLLAAEFLTDIRLLYAASRVVSAAPETLHNVSRLSDQRLNIGIADTNIPNPKLGLDFVPRVGEKVVGSSSVGIFHLYQV
ncbi:hypothetical protein QYM36_003230, partial [Artemia franciscana]